MNGPQSATTISIPATKPILSFCSGSLHVCALFESRQMKCWGLKQPYGSSTTQSDSFADSVDELGGLLPYVSFGSSPPMSQVFCGGFHTCVKVDSGDIKCVGNNNNGQVGLGISVAVVGRASGHIEDALPLVNVGSGLHILDLALGSRHTCVVVTGNKVKCFGKSVYGQLGYGNSIDIGKDPVKMGDSLEFVDLGDNIEVKSIQSGVYSDFNCAVMLKPIQLADRIKCWGYNSNYQLGYGDHDNRGSTIHQMGNNLTLVDLGIESRVKQISLGKQ